MIIKRPKETVSEISENAEIGLKNAFRLRSHATFNGALSGGVLGFLYGSYRGSQVYVTALVGVLIGGLISNILTTQTKKTNE